MWYEIHTDIKRLINLSQADRIYTQKDEVVIVMQSRTEFIKCNHQHEIDQVYEDIKSMVRNNKLYMKRVL
jgi:hypothetical protein